MTSLYRKWRPQIFSEVAGQDHVKTTLLNALKSNRVSHAYLFSGPRGTGKTTMARLLAKALNCEINPQSDNDGKKKSEWKGEPCNKCATCLDITNGQSLDVIEIDAASNRGIEEIRELREKIKFAPSKSRFKIFIIDEVHMLTREAFNALLKTLEEPPAHAVFILATTESHKLLPTIISRCQRYDFRRAGHGDVVGRLKEVAQGEKIKITEEALGLIGQLADGSYRDGLSLLDQVSSVGSGELSVEEIQSILGITSNEAVAQFYEMLAAGSSQKILSFINNLLEDGIDISYFTGRLIEGARQILLIKSGADKQIVGSNLTEEEWQRWDELANKFISSELLVFVRSLLDALKDIKTSPLPQMPLEVTVMDWCQNFRQTKEEVVVSPAVVSPSEEPVVMHDLKKVSSNESIIPTVDAVTSVEEKTNESGKPADDKLWSTILEKVKPHNNAIYALLKDAVLLSVEEDKVVLGVRFRFYTERLYDKKNRPVIEKVVSEVIGRPCRVECQIDSKMPKPQEVMDDELMNSVVEVFGMEE